MSNYPPPINCRTSNLTDEYNYRRFSPALHSLGPYYGQALGRLIIVIQLIKGSLYQRRGDVSTITAVEHSLGGALASLTASATHVTAVTLNVVITRKLVADKLNLPSNDPHIYQFGSQGDAIFQGMCNYFHPLHFSHSSKASYRALTAHLPLVTCTALLFKPSVIQDMFVNSLSPT